MFCENKHCPSNSVCGCWNLSATLRYSTKMAVIMTWQSPKTPKLVGFKPKQDNVDSYLEHVKDVVWMPLGLNVVTILCRSFRKILSQEMSLIQDWDCDIHNTALPQERIKRYTLLQKIPTLCYRKFCMMHCRNPNYAIRKRLTSQTVFANSTEVTC